MSNSALTWFNCIVQQQHSHIWHNRCLQITERFIFAQQVTFRHGTPR